MFSGELSEGRGRRMDRKILIVDDEKNIVEIIAFNLKKEGYQVIKAADGEEGVKMAMEENPDLILLDIMMPKMDGYEACKKIRKKKSRPTMPVWKRLPNRIWICSWFPLNMLLTAAVFCFSLPPTSAWISATW